jgi:hypothetical protein
MNLRALAVATTLALGVTGLSSPVHATVIAPDTPPTTFAMGALPAGMFIASLVTAVTTPTFFGTARSAVYQETATGYLDFLYQFTNDAGSSESVGRITASQFGSFMTDVFQTSSAGGIFLTGDTPAERVDRGANGDVLGFTFVLDGGRLDPGQSSFILQARTTATSYKSGFMGIIDGSGGSAPGFVPAVPEPSTYAMMLAGLGLLGFMVRRKAGAAPEGLCAA